MIGFMWRGYNFIAGPLRVRSLISFAITCRCLHFLNFPRLPHIQVPYSTTQFPQYPIELHLSDVIQYTWALSELDNTHWANIYLWTTGWNSSVPVLWFNNQALVEGLCITLHIKPYLACFRRAQGKQCQNLVTSGCVQLKWYTRNIQGF